MTDFAPVMIPHDQDTLQQAFSTLQTWGPKLQELLTTIESIEDGVLTVGPGNGADGITLASKNITYAQSSHLNIQTVNSFETGNVVYLGFGMFRAVTSNAWIATRATATLIARLSGGTLSFYETSGLTPGQSFNPTFIGLIGPFGFVSQNALSTLGGHVVFPGTPNPSTDANTLDTYAEGTWIPTDVSGAGLTFTSPYGNTYVKIGQLVLLQFSVTYPITVNGAVSIIGNLPFTANTGFYSGPLFTGTAAVQAYAQVNASLANFTVVTNGPATGVLNSALSGSTLYGSVVYRASA